MSQTARLGMVSRPHPHFSIAEQCALLKVPRSTLNYRPKPVSDDDPTLMRRIDEIYMKWPFYGSRRMVEELRGERWDVNRKGSAGRCDRWASRRSTRSRTPAGNFRLIKFTIIC